jgi:predicted dinucleotide-binding enzyme
VKLTQASVRANRTAGPQVEFSSRINKRCAVAKHHGARNLGKNMEASMHHQWTRRATLAAGAGAILLGGRAVAQTKSRIGIIGAGNIGASIGGLWIKAGHPVMFSSRDPDELKDLVARLGPLAHAGTVAQAIAYSDVLFIAVPYAALPQIGTDYKDALQGKIMLDACNAVPTRDGDAITKEADTNGIGITSQKYLAGTRLVRAFNTMGAKTFERESNRPAPRLAIPIAGDDPQAIQVAEGLVRDAGFDPVLAGGLASAKKFQQRSPGAYGFQGNAAELKAKLDSI